MKTITAADAAPAGKPPGAEAPVYPEPTTGGSFTRNPVTGALTKNEPQPDVQLSQE